MSLFSPPTTLLLTLGTLLLIHACYSAHEHSLLLLLGNPSPTGTTTTTTNGTDSVSQAPASALLPTDIALETLAALLLLCTGIVLSSSPLKPIRWAEWAAGVDHGSEVGTSGPNAGKGAEGAIPAAAAGQEGFAWLEKGRRRGFLDIRRERAEFASWARGGGGR